MDYTGEFFFSNRAVGLLMANLDSLEVIMMLTCD